ncbi:SGNH/GDSL hydrolase family protein [Phycisphaera mikurensis]|uniref:SGNH hydrolase-type esterase domain-containing protein n=1 Tax=Phycisphaera mikurensis (strain NBRC 102666 / KCTC 22515 / FYK2301M01) TaxID=1142394 RepID=I0IEL9_PHYMF|nr:GDSL-type esterase/lipase family protein [Phycisphaera mikurensis]MBB6441505.1 lysophospholipase L1-like esterase [Phycisphaera mikurensis]BAM03707.1 hypothetical protein PSMK_15480 [Phycisphaera mikurensis NBRC 102666]
MPAPPVPAPVLLAGSSIFAEWATTDPAARSDRLCPDRRVDNQAVCGTQTPDWLPTLGPLVGAVRPAVLCLYVGSNDLANGRSVGRLLSNLDRLFDDALAACPHTRLLYGSVIRSAHQSARFGDLDAVNEAVARRLRPADRCGFVDLNPLFHAGGRLDGSLFQDDGVHLLPRAYARMLACLQPRIAAVASVRSAAIGGRGSG